MVTDVMAKIAVIIFNFLETFMISWNIVNMMFLCVHCLNDDWQWRDDLETDKAKIKLGLKTTFWNLLCLICFSISHILLDLLEDIDGSIVTYISVDELTWIIAFIVIRNHTAPTILEKAWARHISAIAKPDGRYVPKTVNSKGDNVEVVVFD